MAYDVMEMGHSGCGLRTSTKQEVLEVIDLVQRGKIKPIIYRELNRERANEAIKEIQKRTGVGRTVLTFGHLSFEIFGHRETYWVCYG